MKKEEAATDEFYGEKKKKKIGWKKLYVDILSGLSILSMIGGWGGTAEPPKPPVEITQVEGEGETDRIEGPNDGNETPGLENDNQIQNSEKVVVALKAFAALLIKKHETVLDIFNKLNELYQNINKLHDKIKKSNKENVEEQKEIHQQIRNVTQKINIVIDGHHIFISTNDLDQLKVELGATDENIQSHEGIDYLKQQFNFVKTESEEDK